MRVVPVDAAAVSLELDDASRLSVTPALVVRVDGNSCLVLGAWPGIDAGKFVVFHMAMMVENKSGFIFVRTIFVQKGKCSPFLELTPTL